MRHKKKSEKFSRSRAQRKALIKSLLRSVVIYERIQTTESKAKALRSWVDKLITWGKRDDLHSRRLAYRLLGDHHLVQRLFTDLAPRFKDVNGGYTRVIDVGYRKGDGAKMSILELTRLEPKKKKVGKKEAKTSTKPETKTEALPVEEEKRLDKDKGFLKGIKKIFKKDKGTL